MHDYLQSRVETLAFENAILRMRVKDLLDLIEGVQRFGSFGRHDAERIESAARDLVEMTAKRAA